MHLNPDFRIMIQTTLRGLFQLWPMPTRNLNWPAQRSIALHKRQLRLSAKIALKAQGLGEVPHAKPDCAHEDQA